MKCINCGSKIEETLTDEGKEKYRCEKDHVEERMIDHNSVKSIKHKGKIIHESVGAIIKAEENTLLLKRRKFPYKYSIPAGHMEQGEKKFSSLKREIEEETGINIDQRNTSLLYEGVIEDKCRRGADKHKWHLYLIQLDKKPEIEGNDESEHLKWVKNPLKEELTDITEKFLDQNKDEIPTNLNH